MDETTRRPWALALGYLLGLFLVIGLVALVVGPNLRAARKHRQETRAVLAMKSLVPAQSTFRDEDRDKNGVHDYGTLAQLAAAGLIDEALGSGTRDGYFFAARPSPATSEFLWWATASPIDPGISGDRWFAIGHAGTIFYSTGPLDIDPVTCEIHSAIPVCRCGCGGIKPDPAWLRDHPGVAVLEDPSKLAEKP